MDIYEQYVEVQKQIKTLEVEKEALRVKISAELPEEGVKNGMITAIWRTSKKWVYPASVKELEVNVTEAIKPIKDKFEAEIKPLQESIETAKKLAEENGTATAEETKTLAITVK
jgi:hypothetical protein